MKLFIILFVKLIILFAISTDAFKVSEKFPVGNKRVKLKCLIPISRIFGNNRRCTKMDPIQIPLLEDSNRHNDLLKYSDYHHKNSDSAKNYIKLKHCILNKKLC